MVKAPITGGNLIDNPKYQEMAELSWKIIEAKYWYYRRSEPKLTDYQYDLMEKRYEALCEELGLLPTASNMVDFDTERTCCKHVVLKFEGVSAFRKTKNLTRTRKVVKIK